MCTLENDHYPCRDNSSCIPASKICDNIPHCQDNSDEGPMCKQGKLYAVACLIFINFNVLFSECSNMICAKHCIKTPVGPQCVCPHGFHNPINSDVFHMHKAMEHNSNDNCTDLNECAIYGMCSQKCENTIGSYKCLCDAKYTLLDDKRTCKVSGK